MERARLERHLTQGAVASHLGITQPHYSKIVRGIVALTRDMHDKLDEWLSGNPPSPASKTDEITRIAQRMERDMAKLNRLLAEDGLRASRRARSSDKREVAR